MKLVIFTGIAFLHLTIIYYPFVIAKYLNFQINNTRRQFENIAFKIPMNVAIKQKIELISNLSEYAGFSCFDWFLLEPRVGLKVKEIIQTNLKILKKLYFLRSRSNSSSVFYCSFKATFIIRSSEKCSLQGLPKNLDRNESFGRSFNWGTFKHNYWSYPTMLAQELVREF